MIQWKGPIPTSNYAVGRQNMSIDYIALHHSEASMESMDAHFKSPTEQVSAHYGVARDGRVWQWVQDADTAFAVGNLTGNFASISIEHEELGDDAFTDLQYATSATLINQLCLAHGIPIQRGAWPGLPGIVPHREFSATACPGTLDIDRLVKEAQMAFTPEDKAYLDAKVDVIVAALVAVARREMRGTDPGTAGHDTPILPSEQINPSNGKA